MTLPPLTLETISILLEIIATCLALLAARRKKYMYGLTLTFAIYVFYDLSRYYAWPIDRMVREVLFLIATVSAVFSLWKIYRKRMY